MDRDALVTLGLALCCIASLGTAAGTLESVVSTEPGDVVEVDYESLPISQDDAEEIREQYEDGESGASSQDDSSSAASSQDDSSSSSSSAASSASSSSSSSSSQSQEPDPEQSLLDLLLALLEFLLGLLLRLLPIVAALGAIAAAYRYRDRLIGRAGTDPNGDDEPDALATRPPNDDVVRAWYDMIRQLDLDERREKTPRDFATEAIDRGADPDAVTRLTRDFEAVRYGDEPTTDERASRARTELDRAVSGAGRATDGGERR